MSKRFEIEKNEHTKNLKQEPKWVSTSIENTKGYLLNT